MLEITFTGLTNENLDFFLLWQTHTVLIDITPDEKKNEKKKERKRRKATIKELSN